MSWLPKLPSSGLASSVLGGLWRVIRWGWEHFLNAFKYLVASIEQGLREGL